MLTLAGALRLADATAYRDVVRREQGWATTSTFYVLPDVPRIAHDHDGMPLVDLVWYRTPPGANTNAGGMLGITVELSQSPEERAAAIEALRAVAAREGHASVDVRALPVTGGRVDLTFAGEAGAGDLANAIAGSGPVSMAGAERASFVAELTRDGAALLWEALGEGRDLLHARYELAFEHRLADIELRVWCEAQQAHHVAAASLAAGGLDPSSLRETLSAQHLAGVEVRSETPLAPEHARALETVGARVLEAALAQTLFDFSAPAPQTGLSSGGRVGALRPYAASMSERLNLSFAQSYPLEARTVLEGVLTMGRTRDALGDRVRQVDLRGEAPIVLDVTLHCTVDFAEDLIDTVKVTLDYTGTAPGGRIERRGEVVFREGTDTGRFRTDVASPDQRAYDHEALVYYKGSQEPTRVALGRSDASVIVLDVDRLGVLTVDVALGQVPLESVRRVLVDLEHPPSGQSTRLSLDGEQPSARWQVVIRDAPAEYRFRATWIATDDRRIETAWQPASSKRVFLDVPVELGFGARRSIQLVAAGDFSTIAQIVAAVRRVGATEPPTEFAFTQAGQTAAWNVDLDPAAELRYEVRRTIVQRDGTRRESEWRASDAPVCLVRDDARHEVRILTRLLGLGGETVLALLALEPIDGNAGDRTTLPINDASDARWSFRVGDPDRHRYRYQLTLVTRDGRRTALPWQDAQDELLVLRPPM